WTDARGGGTGQAGDCVVWTHGTAAHRTVRASESGAATALASLRAVLQRHVRLLKTVRMSARLVPCGGSGGCRSPPCRSHALKWSAASFTWNTENGSKSWPALNSALFNGV